MAQEKPLYSIDQDCTAFSLAPDGRVVYSVRHVFTQKRFQMERDDIWVMVPGGKRWKILEGAKLVRGTGPFSYQVRSLRWSPDGQRVAANLLTKSMTDEEGVEQDADLALVLDGGGKDAKTIEAANAIEGAINAEWLSDSITLGFLKEEMKPNLLFSLHTMKAGQTGEKRIFEKSMVAAVAWAGLRNLAVAVERDEKLSAAPVLVLLDLVKQTRTELAKLDEFAGGLSISPSGEKVAYYRDMETLEVREVRHPGKPFRVRALIGKYAWSTDERKVLVKPGAENKSNTLEWITLADGQREPILHDLTFRDFEISPDGKNLAVRIPGKGNIVVYPLR
jgi:dipeptidyl aminopeptidase/acylaminoacyl peptidase